MAADKLTIKINGDISNYQKALKDASAETGALKKQLKNIAKPAAIAFGALSAAIAISTNHYIKYEKALVGVGKTADIEGAALEKFGKQVQNLSKRIPVATNELLEIAQAAGQLGIKGERNLLKFTETIAKLGVATDLTGEQAAVSLARLLGLTDESVDSVDILGSSLVALGNSSKASESEILKMALAVAKSTSVFGVSSGDAAAFGTALKELGQEAQLGGSVVGKSFLKIQKAIDAGGKPLARLSELTGIAGKDLKKTFQDDAAGVFRSFLGGLGSLKGGTTEIFKTLELFKLEGDEVNKVLPILAKNTELLNAKFKTVAKETANATALNKEAKTAFATMDSQIIKLKNSFIVLSTNMGAIFAKTLIPWIANIKKLVDYFSDLDDSTKEQIASFIKWSAIISGGVAALATFGAAVLSASAFVVALGAAFLPATIAASGFWIALTGPIGLAVAGIVGITAAVVALFRILGKKQVPKSIEGVNEGLDKQKEKLVEIDEFLKSGTGRLTQIAAAKERKKEILEEIDLLDKQKVKLTEVNAVGDKIREDELKNIADSKAKKKALIDEGLAEIAAAERAEAERKSAEFDAAFEDLTAKRAEKSELELEQFEEQIEAKRIVDENKKVMELEADGQHAEALAAIEEYKNERIIAASNKKIESDKKALATKNKIDEMNLQATQNFISAGASLAKDGSMAQKALLSANALISTYSAATQALASPPGPPYTIPLAASIGVMGLANVAKIQGVGFADGGIYKGGITGVDSIPALVQKNEIIAPTSSFDEVIEGTARQRGFVKEDEIGSGSGGVQKIQIEIMPQEDAINFIQQQIIEVELQNTGV